MVESNDRVVELTEDKGIIKTIIIKGDEGEKPKEGQEVLVNYEGRLENGTIFDSSYDKEALKVAIGVGQVIKGWDVGIMSMQLGEKAELRITAEYAYGDAGSPPTIPGGATLIFTVELLKVDDRQPTRWLMSDAELIQVALRQKEDGNLKFKEKKWKEAEGFYRDGLAHAETIKNDTEELKTLKKTILQNMSVVTNNTGDFKQSIVNTTKAIEIDGKSAKAHYLRSVAFMKTHQYDEASEDAKNAIKLAPQDKNLRAHWEALKKAKQTAAGKQQAALKKFFAEGVYNEKSAPVSIKKFDTLPAFDQENVQTYFDIEIGTEGEDGFKKGRVVFEVYNKGVPKTAENFRALCTGEKGEQYFYKGNAFHRIIAGFMMQGGDTTAGNGTGGLSIYGDKFEDEGVWYPHTHKGVLSMANAGPNTNGSQFFVCYGPTPHLDGKHTIFGRAIHGFSICEDAENVEKGASDKPLKDVKIVDCGELTGDDKVTAETADFLATYSA